MQKKKKNDLGLVMIFFSLDVKRKKNWHTESSCIIVLLCFIENLLFFSLSLENKDKNQTIVQTSVDLENSLLVVCFFSD
jgi:hypothetical protein